MNKIIFPLLFMLFSTLTNASSLCAPYLEELPILQGGREKPLYVHSKEVVHFLTNRSKFNGESPAVTFCKLSTKDKKTLATLKIPIPHIEIQKLLSHSEKMVSIQKVASQMDLIRQSYMGIKKENSYKKALSKLAERIQLFKSITEGTNWTLPHFGESISWVSLAEVQKIKKGPITKKYLISVKDEYIKRKTSAYLLENTYLKAHLTNYAMLMCVLTIIALVLFKNQYIALFFSGGALALQLTSLTMRVMISGRAPITNMYETVLFSGFGALLLGLIIGHFKKEKIFIYTGAAYNIITLFMISFANEMLDRSIKPLVPVLRDNFWLSTHVTTIILSYSALALSWVLANIVLFKRKFLKVSSKDEKYYADLIYTCMKYGTILLAAGIILGGIWADYSWGRFWGWDPKETWSLIVLCIYIAILHGKYTNWIPASRLIYFTAGAFMSVMMAWFGVNYILASGLHSYGFSQGGAIFLGSFFAIQVLILLLLRKGKKS